MLATAFRNTPNQETDYFREGAEYYWEPPNINGQFAALHHNFYAETDRINVYDANRVLLQHITDAYDYTHNQQLQELSGVDRMNHVDTAFLNCRDDEERTVLWTTMLPSLHHMKRTRRACRHCETNRQVKVAQIHRILGGLSYFVSPWQCARCLDYRCKHEFTNGHWNRTGVDCMCRDCTM
eukprot:scaffold33355_cov36-Attheya_sp.AAC.7